jgi:uncharacterized protein (TIGR03437 family)
MCRTAKYISASFLAAVSASAQCYQFTGKGATLQVNITSLLFQNGPNSINGGYATTYSIESTNTLIVGSTTQTSQSTLTPYKLGGIGLLGGPTAATEITLTVPANALPLSNDAWMVNLDSSANLIPTGVLPQPAAFPAASLWVVPPEPLIDTAYITVYVNKIATVYQITAIGACSANTGGGPGTGGGNTPAIVTVNTAGSPGTAGIAQNTWVEIHGTNLVPSTTVAGGVIWNTAPSFLQGLMPTQLGGVSVTVNGQPAYVYFFCSAATDPACANDQINVLTPLDSTTGGVPIVVTSGGTSTAPFTATMHTVVPSCLLFSAQGYIAATHLNNIGCAASGLIECYVGPATLYPGDSTPAAPGETIVAYATGFGLPVLPLTAGSSTQIGALATLPSCTIGGINAIAVVGFAGVISPGLYQLNIKVPPNASATDNAISCTYGGSTTPAGDLVTVN